MVRAEIQAWYAGFDENGDGVWEDWHGGFFQPERGQPADLCGHVGTLSRLPGELTWDTRWVPDQPAGAVKLIAKVLNKSGLWSVTQPVTGLALKRDAATVRLYRAADVPAAFGVRTGQVESCRIPIPPGEDLSRAVEAGLHCRTWNGTDQLHAPFQFNGLALRNEGKNHHYDYDVHLIPTAELKQGDNVYTIHSTTEHHMLEVLWPGPALVVRYRTP